MSLESGLAEKSRKSKKDVLSEDQVIAEDENAFVWFLNSAEEPAINSKPGSVHPKNFPGFHAVSRGAGKVAGCSEWFLFDRSLVVPEYVVEVEYLRPDEVLQEELGSSKGSDSSRARLGQQQEEKDAVHKRLSQVVDQELSEQEQSDLGPLLRPLLDYFNQISTQLIEVDSSLSAPPRAVEGPKAGDEECVFLINLPPFVRPRPKIPNGLSEQAVLNWSQQSAPERIVYLNLTSCGISALSGLASCVNLEILSATFNELMTIAGLDKNTQLRRLDLGFNLIKAVSGTETLSQLTCLELNNNLIYRLEDLIYLRNHHPKLQELNLRNNAMCEAELYELSVHEAFPKLRALDGFPVTEEHFKFACEGGKQLVLSCETILDRVSQDPLQRKPLQSGNQATLESNCALVERVEINHARITKIAGLERMGQLRDLNFADNEISRIEGLDGCAHLEGLCLEANRITRIEGLSKCLNLKKLDLGKNKLSKIQGLECLVHLTQLSLEDNDIRSLAGLRGLPSLMELYIGNNKISNIKEVQLLREASKLIIVDMLGNPISKEPSYRLYTVFHLRRLKVLDGISISQEDVVAARDQFADRLTAEFLEEKLATGLGVGVRNAARAAASKRAQALAVENASNNGGGGSSTVNNAVAATTRDPGTSQRSASDQASEDTYVEDTASSVSDDSGAMADGTIANAMRGNAFESILELDLSQCRLRRIDDGVLTQKRFPGLRELNLSNNQLVSLRGVSDLPTLQVLRLNNNRIQSLIDLSTRDKDSELAVMPNLEVLQLGFNKITDIASLGLKHTPLLKVLFLQGNEISHLGGLEHCSNLRELVLDKNKIRSLETAADSVRSLRNLRVLRVEENCIRTLGNLGVLVKLHSLYLGFNRLSDLMELDKLGNIPFLLELTCQNNPVARRPMYRPTLVRALQTTKYIDGKEVTQEERERAEALFSPETTVNYAPGALAQANSQSAQSGLAAQVGAATKQGSFSVINLDPKGGTLGQQTLAATSLSRVPIKLQIGAVQIQSPQNRAQRSASLPVVHNPAQRTQQAMGAPVLSRTQIEIKQHAGQFIKPLHVIQATEQHSSAQQQVVRSIKPVQAAAVTTLRYSPR